MSSYSCKGIGYGRAIYVHHHSTSIYNTGKANICIQTPMLICFKNLSTVPQQYPRFANKLSSCIVYPNISAKAKALERYEKTVRETEEYIYS